MKICVLGAGPWGLAIADLLVNKGYDVTVWEFDENVCRTLQTERKIWSKLPGYKIPDEIIISNDINEAVTDSEIVINAVPTQFIRSYFDKIRDVDFTKKIVVNVSKGMEVASGKDIRELFLSEFDTITDDNFVIVAGPSFAIEVALNKTPTAVVAASKNIEAANLVRDVFSNEYFRVYSNDDVIGVEIGGSVKNILAIAAGVIDGFGLGNNTKAAMLTRGLAEMTRFGTEMGAKRETFSGLSGIGDMILTCNSSLSRNWQVGNRIAKGEKVPDIIRNMNMVAEGVETCRVVNRIAAEKNVCMPIVSMVHKVLFSGVDPKAAITELMTREKKVED
ncbi:MAG: NAD(P)H-dependent glycerol-3-phosphate dehydrogenase [Candidatus Delongbacteria bacterium]|jgi:glycerol-3-phosphate dehydrogenase (NAD(P)+)|nr:NAD(P)H-dependent glycerol-3-phosphate dehydrogenase [Candidatus Delongbacteria bacterium]